MLAPRPTRRDPRLLLVERRGPRRLVYVALDPWDVRVLGVIALGRGARLACARLLLQIRPSQLATFDLPPALARFVAALARTRGLPLVSLTRSRRAKLLRDAPTLDDLAHEYPELRWLATSQFARSIRLAGALLTTLSPSLHRRYVSRLPPRPAPAVDC